MSNVIFVCAYVNDCCFWFSHFEDMEVDQHAKKQVMRSFGMPDCLHIPVAARNKDSISRFIGKIERELSKPGTDKAFLVSVPPPNSINKSLPVWELEESKIFHQELQVWVDVDYRGYRNAYMRAFPGEKLNGLVLDHILNRRIARIKKIKYTRLVPVSRAVNSSSAFSENWGVQMHRKRPEGYWENHPQMIQYADLADLVKMLNIQPGGGVMDAVNEAQKLIKAPLEE